MIKFEDMTLKQIKELCGTKEGCKNCEISRFCENEFYNMPNSWEIDTEVNND